MPVILACLLMLSGLFGAETARGQKELRVAAALAVTAGNSPARATCMAAFALRTRASAAWTV